MIYYLSGGCKNGKSMLAQRLCKKMAGDGPLYYVATMIPGDEEDRARIRKHIADREGWGFETLEQGRNLPACLERANPNGTFLLDSVTALIGNEMFTRDGGFHPDCGEKVAEDLATFVRGVKNAVLVSDFIFGDAERYDEWTEAYRRALAQADRVAALCDTVVEVCLGYNMVHKGVLEL
ncbi:MAG: bifunctional adenosylcobinamide kinase/adenosylcobinamide-phosphate guanylyltransferase [Oscillospiraceae bacterium]|nr:bifunctional adenosylcobinamide kinase/adenosylcobinamide-phosphate guanylyltransferase [Oscillospiraceae bacterium]